MAIAALEQLPDWFVGDEFCIDATRRVGKLRRALSAEITTGAFDAGLARRAEAAFIELERVS